MFFPLAKSARKALSLKKDRVFFFLTILIIILGWLGSLGVAGVFSLENMYKAWDLQQSSKVSVYLTPDASKENITKLISELSTFSNIEKLQILPKEEVQKLLSPYFHKDDNFTHLPTVLEAIVKADMERDFFDKKVKTYFPEAEIDDARSILSAVAKGVRIVQGGVAGFALIIFTIMAMLVSLAVRAGLRGKRESLAILQYVGATDSFISSLVIRQVLACSLIGWFGACVLSFISVKLLILSWANISPYFTSIVWLVIGLFPLLLVMVAGVSAWVTSLNISKST